MSRTWHKEKTMRKKASNNKKHLEEDFVIKDYDKEVNKQDLLYYIRRANETKRWDKEE